MSGDRHAGTKRCLHPQERREFISAGDFGKPRERCLDCRALRQKRLVTTRRIGQQEFQTVRWGPWVSAGEQVKQALLAQGSSEVAPGQFDAGAWADICKK